MRTTFEQLTKERRPYASLEEAAEQLVRVNPRLARERALALATHGTERGADGGYRWRFDPLHKGRSPQPFYLEQGLAFWRRVACPVLVVTGELSWVKDAAPDWRQRVAALRDVREVEIAGVGHMIHHERPDLLADAIEEFLGGVTA